MRRMRLLLGIAVLAGMCAGCGNSKSVYIPQNPGGQPMLVHVFNGQQLGFYSASGTKSLILSLGTSSIGTNQQMPLDPNNGRFFLETATCAGGCNDLIYLDSYNGFRYTNLTASEFSLLYGGTTTGAAVNPLLGTVYLADAHSNRVFLMNENSLGYRSGYSAPLQLASTVSPTYMGSDNLLNLVIITDPGAGGAFVMDGTSGDEISTSPFPIGLVGGGCTSASALSFVTVSTANHLAYVLCAGSVTLINLNAALPTYANGNLANSNFALSNISTGTDIAVNTMNNSILVSGGHFVDSLDAKTGAVLTSKDLTTGDCGLASMDLEGLAYDSNDNGVFVADAQNNRVYELDAGSLNFKNGACSTSNFSTPDVPGPKRLSFY